MESTLVKNSSKSTNRRPSIESDHSKKKSARACVPCRKRKVKCSGLQPCDRCIKNSTVTCVYDKPQQKKDTPKPVSENHEPRLKAMEKFLKQFSNLLDNKDPEPPLFSNSNQIEENQIPHKNRLTITTTGQGLYVPDRYLRTDRVPDIYKPGMGDWNPVIQEIMPNLHSISPPEVIREKLLNIYFQFVDPVIPILHKPSFSRQLRSNQPISKLLLNAIYCVSSRWDMDVPAVGEEPRGWGYYQHAVNLLDQQPTAELSTVQALFLLLKYNEHVRRPGFVWRTRYYFQMIVRMCKDLGLTRDIVCTTTNMVIEIEKRKRTFWAVYCYDVMMSIENGTPPNFSSDLCSLDIPHVLADEAQEHEKVVHFILLTKIIRNQADIVNYLRKKYSNQQMTNNFLIQWDEEEEFEILANELKTTIGLITSTTKFPQKESMCYTVCFLYLASCFATILLHRPYALFKQQQQQNLTILTRSHQNHCTEAALNIKLITELILECNAFEDMYCSIRGIQQIVHYLSAAITIFKEGNSERELQETMITTQRLASISPSTEVIGHRHHHQQMNTTNRFSIQSSKSVPMTTTVDQSTLINTKKENKRIEKPAKRKSLHLPASSSNMSSQEDIVEQLNLQQQQRQPLTTFNSRTTAMNFSYPPPHHPNQHIINLNTTHFNQPYNTSNNMSINPDLSNIPNHQSLLGLLLYNEDEGDTSNNIPT